MFIFSLDQKMFLNLITIKDANVHAEQCVQETSGKAFQQFMQSEVS